MLKVNIRILSNRLSPPKEKPRRGEQVFTALLDDIEVGQLAQALVQLRADATEITLDFVDQRYYSR